MISPMYLLLRQKKPQKFKELKVSLKVLEELAKS